MGRLSASFLGLGSSKLAYLDSQKLQVSTVEYKCILAGAVYLIIGLEEVRVSALSTLCTLSWTQAACTWLVDEG